ncbi:MAG: hypothetical protein E7412_01830 [Ruminococcaceae bacterium]|nr:hypothetical protein [Oscillospiraceae bacterium]
MKKAIAFLLALVVMSSLLVGCGDKSTSENAVDANDIPFNVMAEEYDDISDMPDYTGKKLELKVWYCLGSYAPNRNKVATKDVVTPEVARVTGVTITPEGSFDNGGDTQDAKVAKVIATDTWPHLLIGCQKNTMAQLIEEDLVYDLTDLIPKYMPNLNKLLEKDDFLNDSRIDGRLYEITLSAPLEYVYPDMSPELIARNSNPKSDTGYVYVRDDILKKLKPDAYTQKELQAIFDKNHTLTKEEILNGAFNSKEEFFDFLRQVKDLNIKVGNRKVYPTYARTGSDNWDLMTQLLGFLNGYNMYPTGGENYFTYYDKQTGNIEYMFQQPDFKESIKEITALVQEDIVSQDSLVDNRASYEEKCANGEYAVLYGGGVPDIATINKNAEKSGYQYRKVILNIPFNTEKYVNVKNNLTGGTKYAVLKNAVSEEDLPHVLRFIDFMATDVGQKVVQWGPKSAGLFKETENGRRYTDPELEACMVNGEANQRDLYYNLNNKAWPGFPLATNRWQPVYIYDFTPNEAALNRFMSTGLYNPIEYVQGIRYDIYNLASYNEGAEKFWNARAAFETALTKILTAKNDQQFESLYNDMVGVAERNGLTDKTLKELNDLWKNDLNKDYMDNLK